MAQSSILLSQRMVTCLASESSCQGELVEKFRYWMLQMAMLDNILGVCKNIQYSSLKSVVQESGLYLDCRVIVHKSFYSKLIILGRLFTFNLDRCLRQLLDLHIWLLMGHFK